MSNKTVRELAEVVGIPLERLLEQLAEAGLKVNAPDEIVDEDEKAKLLAHLRKRHGKAEDDAGAGAPTRVTLKRRKVSELKQASVPGSTTKVISVEVRKKKTFIKRSEGGEAKEGAVVSEQAVTQPQEHLTTASPVTEVSSEAVQIEAAATEHALAQPPLAVVENTEPLVVKTELERAEELRKAQELAAEQQKKNEDQAERERKQRVEESVQRNADKVRKQAEAKQQTLHKKKTPARKSTPETSRAVPAPAAVAPAKTVRAATPGNEVRTGKAAPHGREAAAGRDAPSGRGAATAGRGGIPSRGAVGGLDDFAEREMGAGRRSKSKKPKQKARAIVPANDAKHQFEMPVAPSIKEVTVPEHILVSELAQKMSVKVAEVIKHLMKLGIMATINQSIDQETAAILVEEMGHKVILQSDDDVEQEMLAAVENAQDDRELFTRAPIVTIMGHVDHFLR